MKRPNERLARKPRSDVALKPTFVVADLDAVRNAAVATGGSLKPAESAWRFRGGIVLDGCDPEGQHCPVQTTRTPIA